jgi:hypothetical protein
MSTDLIFSSCWSPFCGSASWSMSYGLTDDPPRTRRSPNRLHHAGSAPKLRNPLLGFSITPSVSRRARYRAPSQATFITAPCPHVHAGAQTHHRHAAAVLS